jgi:hypothetical protein
VNYLLKGESITNALLLLIEGNSLRIPVLEKIQFFFALQTPHLPPQSHIPSINMDMPLIDKVFPSGIIHQPYRLITIYLQFKLFSTADLVTFV